MFGTLGGPEILLILVVALIVFGPRKLPEMGKSMGRMLAEFRKASTEFKRTIEDEVEAEKTAGSLPPVTPPPPSVPADGEVHQLTPVAPDTPTVSREERPAEDEPAVPVPAEPKQA